MAPSPTTIDSDFDEIVDLIQTLEHHNLDTQARRRTVAALATALCFYITGACDVDDMAPFILAAEGVPGASGQLAAAWPERLIGAIAIEPGALVVGGRLGTEAMALVKLAAARRALCLADLSDAQLHGDHATAAAADRWSHKVAV